MCEVEVRKRRSGSTAPHRSALLSPALRCTTLIHPTPTGTQQVKTSAQLFDALDTEEVQYLAVIVDEKVEGKASLQEILQYVRGSKSSRNAEIFVLASSTDEQALEDTLTAIESMGRGIDVVSGPTNQLVLRMKFRNCVARLGDR